MGLRINQPAFACSAEGSFNFLCLHEHGRIKTLHTLFSMVAQNKKIASIDQKCHIAPFLVFVCFLLFSFAVSFKPESESVKITEEPG